MRLSNLTEKILLPNQLSNRTLRRQINSKYDPALASELLVWIEEIAGEKLESTSGDQDTFYQNLKDGTVLCELTM